MPQYYLNHLKMKRFTVDFISCNAKHGRQTTRVLAKDESSAIQRAVTKTYGQGAFWSACSELVGYGQVARSDRVVGGARCLTGILRVDIERGW